MQQSAKTILDQELPSLCHEISDPTIIANYIAKFADVDKEKIRSEKRERGATYGVHELIFRLKKRGQVAFDQFLEALKKAELNDTYKRLEKRAIEQGLWIVQEHDPVQVETSSSDVTSRGPVTTPTTTTTSPPYSCSEEANDACNPPVVALPVDSGYADCKIDNHSAKKMTNNISTGKPVQGLDTLLKDIQLQLKSKIVSSLNVQDSLDRDWRGLAGVANFTVEQEQGLRSSEKPMEALFQWMVQQEYAISDLISMLRKLGREDLITTIGGYGYSVEVSQQTDELPQGSEPSTSQVSGDNTLTEPTKHKKDAHKLSQEASTDANDGDEEFTTKIGPLSDIPEDDVFLGEIKGKILVLGANDYQNVLKIQRLDRGLYEMQFPFSGSRWDLTTNGRSRNHGRSEELKKTAVTFVSNLEANNVCLVYLAGHTLQICGENYLLPTDISPQFTTADIMECSLNINQLLKEITLRRPLMVLLFIDGAHCNDVVFDANYVLPGLAPIVPPSNVIIVHPCKPGQVRPREEMLSFVQSMKTILDPVEGEDDGPRNLSAVTLLGELNQRYPSSFIFSLSPRSLLPLMINTQEGPAIQSPSSNTPRHSLIFVDDESNDKISHNANHMLTSTSQLGWTAEIFVKSAYHANQDTRSILKDRIRALDEGNIMKVVMVYFIGFQAKDNRSLDIGQNCSINLQWIINLMCEFICGPKVLIVEEPTSRSLDFVTPLPADVLMCLPSEAQHEEHMDRRDCFILSLAQNLSANPEGNLKNVITTTASRWGSQKVKSNLFYA